MKNLDYEGEIDLDFQTTGHYFKSNADNSEIYLINLDSDIENEKCIVSIYTIRLRPHEVENGDLIAAHEVYGFCTIDIGPKYYLIKFEDVYHQWYHNFDGKENKPQGIADVINFAIKLGLYQTKITLR